MPKVLELRYELLVKDDSERYFILDHIFEYLRSLHKDFPTIIEIDTSDVSVYDEKMRISNVR
jgi:hypothetical protein